MTAVLLLPEVEGAPFVANLVDRPFLRHIVEFVTHHGIREITVVGPDTQPAQTILGSGHQWDAFIEYSADDSVSAHRSRSQAKNPMMLLASASSLPPFPLKQQLERATGAIIHEAQTGNWTGWALIEPQDVARLPSLRNRAGVLSYLRTLSNYAAISAEIEFRCDSPQRLWRAHQDALESNLSLIYHGGLEVKPGVWMGRNASVSASVEVTAPVYIGENCRIYAGAQIGPFAAIGKDCLIAPGTTVRHAAIAPGTYAGNDLDLDHVLVNKGYLFDVRLGVSVDRVDPPILDGVFDFRWTASGRFYQALASAYSKLKQGLASKARGPVAPHRKPPAVSRSIENADGKRTQRNLR